MSNLSVPTQDENFWEDFLDSIEGGRVIPVIGEGAVTFGEDSQRLYSWLAIKLAESLQIPLARLEGRSSLNEVVCLWLLEGGIPNTVYTRINRILRDESLQPGATLRDLASISAFNLYLTTTFDSLMEKALNTARFGGKELTLSLSFSDNQDLPFRKRELSGATVYHLLGKASPRPEFAVWEEDALEVVCALHQHLNVMEKLSRDLKEHSLLVIGLSFSDWLVRFFLRIARQDRFSSSTNIDYIADGPPELMPPSMVLFFGGASKKKVQVIPCDPAAFTHELAKRWRDRYPVAASSSMAAISPDPPPAAQMPRGAIFISYAREDEDAVKRLKAGLEQHGCLVWFDRDRLKPGAHWHGNLQDEVKERCSLFLSVVSRTTENTPSGYFHQERNWAAERAPMFSEGEEFYIPVMIDDLPMPFQREPRIFKSIQATLLPAGEVQPAFGEHLHRLQEKRRTAATL